MKVTDKVYKVITDWVENKLTVAEYQILRIQRHDRLVCFRLDKPDHMKAAHNFSPHEVSDSVEGAIHKYKDKLMKEQKDLQYKLDQYNNLLLGELSVNIY